MNLNSQKLEAVALAAFESAQAKGGKDARRWTAAITKAKQQLESNPYISDEGGALLILRPDSPEIYHANGTCQCQAWLKGKYPCWHRAAHRLVRLYAERERSH